VQGLASEPGPADTGCAPGRERGGSGLALREGAAGRAGAERGLGTPTPCGPPGGEP